MRAERCQQPVRGDAGELSWEQGVTGGCHPLCVSWHFDSALLWGCWAPTVMTRSAAPPLCQGQCFGAGLGILSPHREVQLGMLSTGHTEPLEGPSSLAAGEVLTPK